MSYVDISGSLDRVVSITAESQTASQVGAAVDLIDGRGAAIDSGFGTQGITFDGTNYINLQIEVSADNSTWVNATSDDLGGTDVTAGVVASYITPALATAGSFIPITTGKRYVRATHVRVGTHGTASIGWANVIRGPKITDN